MLLLSIQLARAAEVASIEVPPGAFRVHRADAELTVGSIGLPKPLGIDSRFRLCRVSVAWVEGKVVPTRRDGCHPNVFETVDEAAARWVIDVTHPPERDRELFEFWYVFPAVKGGQVRVYVRQAYDQELVLTTPDVELLEWSVKGRLFPEFPPEALTMDTTYTTCTARVDLSATGVPGEIVVDGCDEVFRADLAENLRSWRFGTPELDGVPFFSGVTLGFRFSKPLVEGEEGTVEGLFPPDPDLGTRTRARIDQPLPTEPEPPPKPTWPAKFVTDHKSFAQVGVYDVRWPEIPPLGREATCDVLFQVNSQRRVWAWAEACDEAIRAPVEAAAANWLLMAREREPGERYARFRGTFVVPADGSHVRLRIPEGDLVTDPKALPEYVETFRIAHAITTVPPKLPGSFATETLESEVTCEYDVEVDPRGRPDTISARSCPRDLGEYAEKALRQWRWEPAESDGEPIASRVVVRIRFDLGVKSASR